MGHWKWIEFHSIKCSEEKKREIKLLFILLKKNKREFCNINLDDLFPPLLFMCARHSSSRSNRFPLPHPFPSFHETTLIKTLLPGSLSTPHPILLAPLYNYTLLLYPFSHFFLSPIINDATCLYSKKSEKKSANDFSIAWTQKNGEKKRNNTTV